MFEDRDDRLDLDALEEQRKRLIYGEPDGEDPPDPTPDPEDTEDPEDPENPEKKVEVEGEDPKPEGDKDSKPKETKPKVENYDLPKIEEVTTPSDPPKSEFGPVDHLTDEEVDEIEIAKYAEKHFKDKHKGLAKKVYDFYSERDKYIENARSKAEEDGYEWSEDDEDYQRWLQKHQPSIPPRDRREIVKKMLKDEVLNEVQPELETMRLQQWQQEQRKRYQGILENFQSAMMDSLPDTFPNDEEKLKVAIQENPEEWGIISEEVNKAAEMSTLYLNLSLDHESVNLNDPTHKAVNDWINREGEKFYKEGKEHRFRDGKKFVPVATFNQLSEKDQKDYWTFSEEEVVKMIQVAASRRISKRITEFNETVERVAARKGYAKAKEKPAKETPPPSDDDSSVKVTPGVRVPSETASSKLGKESWVGRMGYLTN